MGTVEITRTYRDLGESGIIVGSTTTSHRSVPVPGELALPSLEIHNFRGLRELRISRLGRVNLITGKNNVGKTSVLEALRIYATTPPSTGILDVLRSRGQLSRGDGARGRMEQIYLQVGSLFTGRRLKLDDPDTEICIGPLGSPDRTLGIMPSSLSGTLPSANHVVSAADRSSSSISVRPGGKQIAHLGLMLRFGDSSRGLPLEDEYEFRRLDLVWRNTFGDGFGSGLGGVWVQSNGLDTVTSHRYWSRAAIAGREDDVNRGVRLIDPSIESVFFAAPSESASTPTAFVRRGGAEPAYLSSYGDGTNRLLGLSLAMIESAGCLALIDEVENGLHYSVQADVWRHLFALASQLNIQIFATTHSSDCVRGFQVAASESEEEGRLIYLGRRGDTIVAEEFDEDSLEIANEVGMELRG